MKFAGLLSVLLVLSLPGVCAARAAGDTEALPGLARAWLSQQVAQAYPDSVAEIQVAPPDSRLRLEHCSSLVFSLPAGSQLWSGGSLHVKCDAPRPWQLYLTYKMQITGPALVTREALPAQHLLTPGNLVLANIRYTANPGSYVQETPDTATTLRPLAAGQAVLIHDLRLPDIIRAGDKVRVRVNGRGFSVAQEGKSLNAAKPGGLVRVKMPNGRTVQGTATLEGEVEIAP